jgi:MFS family permease
VSDSPKPPGPLAIKIFRALWLAGLVSNVGSFMHGVGASWLLTSLSTSPAIVALLQTATSLPSFMLALPAGALADVFDRRRLLLVTQTAMALIAGGLAVVTFADVVTPTWLLVFSVLLSIAGTINMPNWVALTPELVPRDQLAGASGLNAISMNIAQAIGPAIGGIVIAAAGAAWVFALNAVSFAGVILVIQRWRRPARDTRLPPEHVVSAMRTGLRYVGNERNIQVVLVRIAVVMTFSSALAALMPVIARASVGATAGQFGLLSGALGVGAVAAALIIPRLRLRFGPDAIVAAGTSLLAVALVGVGQVTSVAPFAVVLFVGGFGQLLAFTSIFAIAQAVLPAWVRGRGLAIAMLVVQGVTAAMAALWGSLAGSQGPSLAMTVAGVGLLISSVLVAPLRLRGRAEIDLTPITWGELHTSLHLHDDQGPVLIDITWVVDPADVAEFTAAMAVVRRQRRRDGAVTWGLYEDVDRPGHLIESFLVASWAEHERQHDRPTAADQVAQEPARQFLVAGHAPHVRHHIGRHTSGSGRQSPPHP